MNTQEAVKLARLVRALCPSQQLDAHTPDAWAIVLDDISYEDAQIAVRTLYRERGNDQEFGGRRIEADDIIREVRRQRNQRIDRHAPVDPPSELDPAEYKNWLLHTRKAIADGQQITAPELPQRDMSGLRAIEKRPA